MPLGLQSLHRAMATKTRWDHRDTHIHQRSDCAIAVVVAKYLLPEFRLQRLAFAGKILPEEVRHCTRRYESP